MGGKGGRGNVRISGLALGVTEGKEWWNIGFEFALSVILGLMKGLSKCHLELELMVVVVVFFSKAQPHAFNSLHISLIFCTSDLVNLPVNLKVSSIPRRFRSILSWRPWG